MPDHPQTVAPDSASHSPIELNAENLSKLVKDFYNEARQHPLLGPVFERELSDRWDAHLTRMVDFWSTVMLGTHQFRGNLVHRHMQLQNVTPEHFKAWIRLWTRHTSNRFDGATTYKLRRVAHDIGRQLFVSYFDALPNARPHHAAQGLSAQEPTPARKTLA